MHYYIVRVCEKKEIKVIHKIFDAAHVAYLQYVQTTEDPLELIAVDTNEFGVVTREVVLYTYDREAQAVIIHQLVQPNGLCVPV